MHPQSHLAKLIDAETLRPFRITVPRDEPGQEPSSIAYLTPQKAVGQTVEGKTRDFTTMVYAVSVRDAWALFCDSTGHRRSIKEATIEPLAA